jgi:hypothetical protein
MNLHEATERAIGEDVENSLFPEHHRGEWEIYGFPAVNSYYQHRTSTYGTEHEPAPQYFVFACTDRQSPLIHSTTNFAQMMPDEGEITKVFIFERATGVVFQVPLLHLRSNPRKPGFMNESDAAGHICALKQMYRGLTYQQVLANLRQHGNFDIEFLHKLLTMPLSFRFHGLSPEARKIWDLEVERPTPSEIESEEASHDSLDFPSQEELAQIDSSNVQMDGAGSSLVEEAKVPERSRTQPRVIPQTYMVQVEGNHEIFFRNSLGARPGERINIREVNQPNDFVVACIKRFSHPFFNGCRTKVAFQLKGECKWVLMGTVPDPFQKK